MVPYKIEGEQCGRDKNGVFHCECGKCEPLRTNKSKDGSDSSYDGGKSGNCGD